MSTIQPFRAKRVKKSTVRVRPVERPDAAGIDLGATVHFVAVPPERDPQPVRSFATDTAALHLLADWLVACRIKTVAMEATGVYWIPLFQILEARGLEVVLANARHVKNVPARKTDVQDCQWLQYLHSVGLLQASFRPPAAVCAIRSLVRQRDNLVRTGCEHILRLQKALDEMNVLLHRAVSDITGETGLAILDAIVAGERDPAVLAGLRDRRCKKSEAEIAAALRGDWQPEHLFVLRQSLEAWRYHRKLAAECDAQIQLLIQELTPVAPPATVSMPSSPRPASPTTSAGDADEPLRRLLLAKLGTDLTAVDGVGAGTALVWLSEVGPALDKFPTAAHFASWLGLCPDNRVSGGRKLATATRPVANRLATALRMAAVSLSRSDCALGLWYRRLRAKLGPAPAVTATAHKIARILFAMVKLRRPFDPAKLGNPSLQRSRHERSLRRQATSLGFALQPLLPDAVS